ncbi:MAG: MFS transporter [Desulfobacterales bacterium]|nr:MFS transporter [Desulfobacterales bacterium]
MSSESAALQAEVPPFRSVLPGLMILSVIFLFNFVSRVIIAPHLPEIEQDFGLSHNSSGSFFLFSTSGYFFSIICSGFVSSRLSHKRTIVLSSIASGFILCLLSFSSSLIQIRWGLFCLGLSAGLYLPSGLATITKVLPPTWSSRGMSLHEFAPNVAISLCIPVAFLISGGSISAFIVLIGDHYYLGVGIIISGVLMSFSGFLAIVYQVRSQSKSVYIISKS